jgi:ankyrin repeat protein
MAPRLFHGIRAATKADAFAFAAAKNKLRELKLLLADKVDINAVAPAWRGTALNVAAYSGAVPATRFLIEAGADLNPLDNFELTPLMIACSHGKAKCSAVALLLIEAGADVRHVRDDGMTALKFSVDRCTVKVIQALIDHGAEVDGPRGTEQTALMLAARANNVEALKLLVKNGADVTRKCKLPWAEDRTAEGLAELEHRRAAQTYLANLAKTRKKR